MKEKIKKIEKRISNIIYKKLICENQKEKNIRTFIIEIRKKISETFTQNEKEILFNYFQNLDDFIEKEIIKFYTDLKTHTVDNDLKIEKTKEILQEQKQMSFDDCIFILKNKDLENYNKGMKSGLLADFIQEEIILDCFSKNWNKSSKIISIASVRAIAGLAFLCSNGLIDFIFRPIDNKNYLFEYKVNRNLLTNSIIEKLNRQYNLNMELNTSQPIPIVDLNPDATTEEREREEEEIIKKWIDEDLKRC